MGLTLSDIDRGIYYKFRSQGMTHDEAISKFPDKERIEKDLKMTDCESHFGVKSKTLLYFVLGPIVVALILLIILNT